MHPPRSKRSNARYSSPKPARSPGSSPIPIQKKTLQDAGFRHPGHTEFLAELAGGVEVAMMLACPQLRVIPVTIHQSLADAVKSLDGEQIVRAGPDRGPGLAGSVRHSAFAACGGGAQPARRRTGARWATRSAGIIVPAIEALQREGIAAHGPAPADTMFHAAARPAYDVALCMYHDQALIPSRPSTLPAAST